jgi:hypothetical protein
MTTQRLSSQGFDITIGDIAVNVTRLTLDITDNTSVAKTRGVPDGYISGDVEAKGELELNQQYFNLLQQAARKAGSWQGLDPFDITCFGQASLGEGAENTTIEVFGCKLVLTSLLNIDNSNSPTQTTVKVDFMVTSSDFVRINGIPYLAQNNLPNLN